MPWCPFESGLTLRVERASSKGAARTFLPERSRCGVLVSSPLLSVQQEQPNIGVVVRVDWSICKPVLGAICVWCAGKCRHHAHSGTFKRVSDKASQ